MFAIRSSQVKHIVLQILEQILSRTPVLALALSCLASVLTLAACTNSSTRPAEVSVYDRVMQHGIIHCGYAIYNPGCIKDPNTGKLSGIGVDTLELIAKNLGLKVVWTEEVGWGTMIEGLQTNRYDIIATPVWATADRARVIDFSEPLYFSPVFAYVKTGNKAFDSKDLHSVDLSKLNSPKYSIASIDGATAAIIGKEDFPRARVVSLPQLSDFSQLLLTVASGKADITFTESADASAFIKHNPGSIEKVGEPVRLFPNCWIFRRGQLEFKDMIDTALKQVIYSGAVDKIIQKYEATPGTLFRTASPYVRH